MFNISKYLKTLPKIKASKESETMPRNEKDVVLNECSTTLNALLSNAKRNGIPLTAVFHQAKKINLQLKAYNIEQNEIKVYPFIRSAVPNA